MKSNSVDQYILKQKGSVRVIMEVLNDFLTSDEMNLSSTLKYGMPFYQNNKKTICYLHKCKNDSLDITFWYGKELIPIFSELQQRNRKRMASLNYYNPEEINLSLVREIVDETRKRY